MLHGSVIVTLPEIQGFGQGCWGLQSFRPPDIFTTYNLQGFDPRHPAEGLRRYQNVRPFMLVAVCALLLGPDKKGDKQPMADQEKIQGTWALVAGERSGKLLPGEVAQHVKLVFARDKRTTRNKDRHTEATFKLDSSKTPKEIDLDMEGNVGKGIYQLDGDNLKIAHGEVGDARPREFPKPGSGLTVLVLKREQL
jgi:uncharacterized protein (TIGR03067 family)